MHRFVQLNKEKEKVDIDVLSLRISTESIIQMQSRLATQNYVRKHT